MSTTMRFFDRLISDNNTMALDNDHQGLLLLYTAKTERENRYRRL